MLTHGITYLVLVVGFKSSKSFEDKGHTCIRITKNFHCTAQWVGGPEHFAAVLPPTTHALFLEKRFKGALRKFCCILNGSLLFVIKLHCSVLKVNRGTLKKIM